MVIFTKKYKIKLCIIFFLLFKITTQHYDWEIPSFKLNPFFSCKTSTRFCINTLKTKLYNTLNITNFCDK